MSATAVAILSTHDIAGFVWWFTFAAARLQARCSLRILPHSCITWQYNKTATLGLASEFYKPYTFQWAAVSSSAAACPLRHPSGSSISASSSWFPLRQSPLVPFDVQEVGRSEASERGRMSGVKPEPTGRGGGGQSHGTDATQPTGASPTKPDGEKIEFSIKDPVSTALKT